jgi:hypothetical protein
MNVRDVLYAISVTLIRNVSQLKPHIIVLTYLLTYLRS